MPPTRAYTHICDRPRVSSETNARPSQGYVVLRAAHCRLLLQPLHAISGLSNGDDTASPLRSPKITTFPSSEKAAGLVPVLRSPSQPSMQSEETTAPKSSLSSLISIKAALCVVVCNHQSLAIFVKYPDPISYIHETLHIAPLLDDFSKRTTCRRQTTSIRLQPRSRSLTLISSRNSLTHRFDPPHCTSRLYS